MIRKGLVIGLLCLLVLLTFGSAQAQTFDREDVVIAPGDTEDASIVTTSDDYEIDIEVMSDIPVNVYVFESEDYSMFNPDFSKAKTSKKGITETDFTYKVKTSGIATHYLVIENPSTTQNATVDYSYTSNIAEVVEEAFWYASMVCIAIIVVIVVVIIVIVVLVIHFSKKKKQQQPPPPPQQGYQQPPQQPPQQGYQQPPQQPGSGYQQPPPPPPGY